MLIADIKKLKFDKCDDLVIEIEDEDLRILSTKLEFNHLTKLKVFDSEEAIRIGVGEMILERIIELKLRDFDDNFSVSWIDEGEIKIYSNKSRNHFYLNVDVKDGDDETEIIIEFLKNIQEYKYQQKESIYIEDYYECLIEYENWVHEMVGWSIKGKSIESDAICYEISKISNEFKSIIELNERFDSEEFDLDHHFSLKIFKLNKELSIEKESKGFADILENVKHSIAFEISQNHSVDIRFSKFVCDFIDIEPHLENISTPIELEICKLKNRYDKDLLRYYYEASTMEISEFQYIAYYRVIECIFDEVYRAKTINDIKNVINSDGFSTYSDTDLEIIVEIVEKYQRSKSDREKINLIFDKYLKGDLRDEAFYHVNSTIISILKDDMKLITKDSDFKDMRKIGNIVYDFRCQCTHSNRAFNKRQEDADFNEISNYIKLIKKICQMIIRSYQLNK